MKKTFKPLLIASAVAAVMTAGAANAWTTALAVTELTNGNPANLSVRKLSFSDPAFGYQSWAMHGAWATFTAKAGQQVAITVDGSANVDFHPALTAWKRPIGTPEAPYKYKGGQMTNLTMAKYVPDHNFTGTESYINSGSTQQHIQDASLSFTCTDSADLTCATQTRTFNDTTTGQPVTVTAKTVEFWGSAKRDTLPTGATGVLLEDGTTDIGLPRMIRAASVADGDGAAAITNKLNYDPNLKVVKDGVAGKVTAYFVPNESVQYQVFFGGWNAGANAVTNNPITVTIMGAAN